MMIKTHICGLAELNHQLRIRLPQAVRQRVLRAALRAGAKIIVRQAKALAPVDSGALKKHIRARANRKGKRGCVDISIGVFARKGQDYPYYWRFLELGTCNLSARPFLRPALDNQQIQVIEAIRKKLKQRIDAEISQGG